MGEITLLASDQSGPEVAFLICVNGGNRPSLT